MNLNKHLCPQIELDVYLNKNESLQIEPDNTLNKNELFYVAQAVQIDTPYPHNIDIKFSKVYYVLTCKINRNKIYKL